MQRADQSFEIAPTFGLPKGSQKAKIAVEMVESQTLFLYRGIRNCCFSPHLSFPADS